ncbi:MAG: hypothetical protein CO141_03150 [Candidatus Moranbacteria bacterium CG_4_9_14_3_um_filter_42_9]|nr:MAG: hypothetical protein CO141_03150 [Candidatus Moranbacteria bacterium CG_4_9_14_3_um_filter_42_9]
MGRIVIIDEERCGDCHGFIQEVAYEVEELFLDSENSGPVKRRIKIRRCKKCQPIFEQKIANLKKEGKVKKIPFGMSGQNAEDRQTTLRDFIGRDRKRVKKEMGGKHGNAY